MSNKSAANRHKTAPSATPGFLLLRLPPLSCCGAPRRCCETELPNLAGGTQRGVQPGLDFGAEKLELLGPDRRAAAHAEDAVALGNGLRLGRHAGPGDLRPQPLGLGQGPRGGGSPDRGLEGLPQGPGGEPFHAAAAGAPTIAPSLTSTTAAPSP